MRALAQCGCLGVSANINLIRREANALAAQRVRADFGDAMDVDVISKSADDVIESLSVEEELEIVEIFSDRIVHMGELMEPQISGSIIATAIQYLRRFYLTNSPMIYDPHHIATCALFLAMKADHCHIPLHDFVTKLDDITEDVIKESEIILMQSLRFTLEVRHPMRGLEGGIMKLQALATSNRPGLLQGQKNDKYQDPSRRIADAAKIAKAYLHTAAQITDVYFLYTPSQIWLGALFAADRQLATCFLDHLFLQDGLKSLTLSNRLLPTVEACSDLLLSYQSIHTNAEKKGEITKVLRKLKKIQKRTRHHAIALAKVKAAQKRERIDIGAEGQDFKKRRLEPGKPHDDDDDDDVFGPSQEPILIQKQHC